MSIASLGTLAHIVEDAEVVGSGSAWAALQIQRVHTDTRTLQPGDLYVALTGPRFDGNALLAQACDAGAVAVVCAGEVARKTLPTLGCPAFVVPDTRRALGQIAHAHRLRCIAQVVAIAGSNGKTTVTQMVGAILRHYAGDAALATEGNHNNEIGVPLTLLRLTLRHRYAVVELGTNHPGEIAVLARIAQPSIALVNNAQRDHVQFFASVEDVARENGAALQALPAWGKAVYPADEAYASLWAEMASHCGRIMFSASADIDATLRLLDATWKQDRWQIRVAISQVERECTLPMPGWHNVRNALAAAACALAAGLPWEPIAQGLASFTPVRGRSRVYRCSVQGRGLTVVDDTYNANPDSMRAAIDLLATLPAPQWLVLGDMGELGADALAMHREVLEYALSMLQGTIYTIGPLFAEAARSCAGGSDAVQAHQEHGALLASMLPALPGAGSVLCKGSRAMRMETVLEGVLAACDGATDQDSEHRADHRQAHQDCRHRKEDRSC
ncbi:UDP-N-acetylmuramoyl-tripeptide--D-alanyl-D-alanine ligase [Candidatus Symbiobacter mobilis]|uniref:UDP-N-acetylmuramoyl-tripeptide--D-alanyl-D-alanine ligase n=1 Tax=Candidatus Symbiobacter mobilis CR TaxID=946483 RepID=U5N9X6_9BURK|nr:UDP-N-acetylmuramoyl-tripeptide--D-alanyl-D-alanine ligase [Candidatus Symbiobacter mobilis]AGX86994.1 UDP-N-acetylmuramoylalanyl pentapeptide synthase [Candidatus Symbiobacter mobilis CR]